MTRNKRLIITHLILFIFLICPCMATAGEPDQVINDLKQLSLEKLMEIEVKVYAASKFEQKTAEAPASVSIVTADEIRKYGFRTLADILRSVKGFYTTYDRFYHYLGARGFNRPGDYNSRFLLLVDGHRLNDSVYYQGAIGTEFVLDVDLIDRVEIIRGPGSSLYGTNAFFGVINIITRDAKDLGGLEASGEAGSYDTFKGRMSYGKKFDSGVEMILSGTHYDSKGQNLYYKEFDNPATNNGIARHCDDDQFESMFGKLKSGGFLLEGGYVEREKGVPTAFYETVFNDDRNRAWDRSAFLDLKYQRAFSEQLNVTARLYYDYYSYRGDYVYDRADSGEPPRLIVQKDDGQGQRLGGEVQVNKRLMERHHLAIGAEFKDNFRQDQKNYDIDEVYLDDKRDSMDWALYIQDEFKALDNLILNAGVRYDHYETFGGTTNPRLALIYKPFEKTALKLLYGQAFRAPNAYELYYHDGGITQKADPDLNPEEITTYELVWEQRLSDHISFSASGFYYETENLISQQTDPADGLLVYNNVDEITGKGMELEVKGKWRNGLQGGVSYTFQETEDRKTGQTPVNSPRHLAKFHFIVPLLKDRVFAGTEVLYTGKRKSLADDHADDFWITNLTLFSKNLIKGLEISASAYNLFDKKYEDPVYDELVQDLLEQDGLTFRLKLTYRF